MAVNVGLMGLDDLDEIMEIEHLSFAAPWSRASFVQELTANQRAIYLVATDGGKIAGYIGLWVVLDEGHITNIAVHPTFRRQGIAGILLDAMTMTAQDRGVSALTLEVRQSNLGAQRLYEKHGFASAGLRRHYYHDNNEDALIMWKTI